MICNRKSLPIVHGTSICTAEQSFRTAEKSEDKAVPISRDVVYSILQECIKHKDVSTGRKVYTLMVFKGLDNAGCFSDHLIRLFASCSSLPEASHVFNNATCPRIHTWNAIVTANVNLGQNEGALDLYQKMLQTRAALPDKVTFSCILKACSALGALEQGMVIHSHILEEELESNVIIMNTVVDLYGKSWSIEDAQRVFDGLLDRTVVSWAAIIGGYSQQGDGPRAIEFFHKMQCEGFEPSRAVFLAALKACSILRDIIEGKKLHDQIIRCDLESDVSIESTLVDMYAKCGSMDDADAVFKDRAGADEVKWGTIIAGYADNGQELCALEAYDKMQERGVRPNTAIFSSLLKACSGLGELKQGMQIHEGIRKAGLELDLAVRNGLIDMYSKCGSLERARQIFDESANPDNVLWGAIITAYLQHGSEDEAIEVFEQMIKEGTRPKAETYMSMLKSCIDGYSWLGWLLYDEIVRGGFESILALGSAIIDMYGRCGNIKEARCVFERLSEKNVVSWGGLIASYVQQGLDLEAMELFSTMLEGVKPDRATVSCVLKACGSAGFIKQGRLAHDLILRSNFESDPMMNSSLVDMYARCGILDEACNIFDKVACQDIVLWGVMIESCTSHGELDRANYYLSSMRVHGLKPIDSMFTSMLTACCYAGDLAEGSQYFRSMIEEYGISPNVEHYSCMIDLLSRAGHLNDAQALLQSIPSQPDFVVWTSILTGCKTYGDLKMASTCFEKVSEVIDPKDASAAHVLMSHMYENAWMREKADTISELRKISRAWKKPGKAWVEISNKMHEFVVDNARCHVREDVLIKFANLNRLLKEEGLVPQVVLDAL